MLVCTTFYFTGQDACAGDSGGPLISRTADGANGVMYLKGIVSYGDISCDGKKPGVYTNVAHYIDWIKQNIKP